MTSMRKGGKSQIAVMDRKAFQEHMDAQARAPHLDREAYMALLAQRQTTAQYQAEGLLPIGQNSGGDVVLAAGPHEGGGFEMLVRKADGVVVLLAPQQPQVKNTPRGPKMTRTVAPLEMPLVRRTAPTELSIQINRYVLGERPLPALLLFQSRFSTVAREVNLM